jgi:hypothetical protein
MIESLNAIRSLNLAPAFESLYFGREVPASLDIYMTYPAVFRGRTLAEGGPLTAGGLVPIVDDGNGVNICLFDPRRGAFVVKSIEEPDQVVREFSSWQQFLAYALLEIADAGPSEDELRAVAQATGFSRTSELLALLRELETLSDRAAVERCEAFIDGVGHVSDPSP